MKKIIKHLFTVFGLRLSRYTAPDPNLDAFQMQKILLHSTSAPLIFDVGAYDGEVSKKYHQLFPSAKIYSFEPFPESYEKMKLNVSTIKEIIPVNKGVGQQTGKSKFHSNKFAPTNSLLGTSSAADENWGNDVVRTIETVDIDLTTIDDFVTEHNIRQIDILKMDVQGSEFMVLNGASSSIKNGIIKMIYTEIITRPTYHGQKEFDEIMRQFRECGFELYNFYNNSLTGKGQLRQLDAIFIQKDYEY